MPNSLIGIILAHARRDGGKIALRYLQSGDAPVCSLSYRDLVRSMRRLSLHLGAHLAPGEPVLLCGPTGLDYVAGFLGCLAAGLVPVPVFAPRNSRHVERLWHIRRDCGARYILSTRKVSERLDAKDREVLGRWLFADDLGTGEVEDGLLPEDPVFRGAGPARLVPGTPAFLQYTSGSTSDPKGVMVSHANLLHNLNAIAQGFGNDETAIYVNWMPLYHDMGLIGTVLESLFVGGSCVL